jgi:hypothetical protein
MSLRLTRAALGLLFAAGLPQTVHALSIGPTFTATLVAGDLQSPDDTYSLIQPVFVAVDLFPAPYRTAFTPGAGGGNPGQSMAVVRADRSNSRGLANFLANAPQGGPLWLEITITNVDGSQQPSAFAYPVNAPGHPSGGQGGVNSQAMGNPGGQSHDEFYWFPITSAPNTSAPSERE